MNRSLDVALVECERVDNREFHLEVIGNDAVWRVCTYIIKNGDYTHQTEKFWLAEPDAREDFNYLKRTAQKVF